MKLKSFCCTNYFWEADFLCALCVRQLGIFLFATRHKWALRPGVNGPVGGGGCANSAERRTQHRWERERVAEVKTWHTVHYLAVLIIRSPNRFLFFARAAPRIFHSQRAARASSRLCRVQRMTSGLFADVWRNMWPPWDNGSPERRAH